MERIEAIDTYLFILINQGIANPLFDLLMPLVTEKWNYLVPSVFGLIIMVIYERDRRRLILFLSLLTVGVGVVDLFGMALKEAFQRLRPCQIQEVRLLGGCTDSFSMPSSHAVNAFFIATLLSFRYRRLWVPFITVALLVALSRVYIGVHYPSDVVVGGLIGLLWALLFSWLEVRLDTILFRRVSSA